VKKEQNGSKPRSAGMTFSPNRRMERITSAAGRSEKLNSPRKTLNTPSSAVRRNFAATVSGEPM